MLSLFVLLDTVETEEKSKFTHLYLEYKNLMLYIAKNILHDEGRAENVVHNAFVVVLENIDCIDEIESARTKNWLSTIVKNHALNEARHYKFGWDIVAAEDEMERVSDIHRVEEITDEYDLKALIAIMPEKYRDVLNLVVTYGLNYKTISKVLGLTESASRKRFERAKKMLKDLLHEKGEYIDDF